MIFNVKDTQDAKTLDGHGAEYFAPLEALERFTITRYTGKSEDEINSIYDSLHTNSANGEWYRARVFHNVVHSVLGGGTWYVEGYRQTETYGWQKTTCYTSNGVRTFTRMLLNKTTWTGWVADFTTDGGTVTGDITQQTEGKRVMYNLKNDKRRVYQEITTDGTYYLFDDTNKTSIIRSELDGTARFIGTASGNLPLTGGTLKRHDYVIMTLESTMDGDRPCIKFVGTSGNLGYLGFETKDNPCFFNSNGASRTLLHTGNSSKVVISETAPSDTSALWVY